VDTLSHVLSQRSSNDQWDGITEQYEKYSSILDNVFQFESGFCQIVSIYIQTFSVIKLKTKLIPEITKAVISIIQSVSSYISLYSKYAEKIIVSIEKDQLQTYLSNFSRSFSWYVGMTAYKLIKVKEATDKSSE
jgi:hypothetical protein